MRTKPSAWKKRGPGVPAALALAVGQCWAQAPAELAIPKEIGGGSQAIQIAEPPPVNAVVTPPPSNQGPAAASSALPVEAGANSQVLQAWQQQTGQAAWVNDEGKVEFHGAITVDAYDNSVKTPSGNPLLSPLPRGTYGKVTVQGDVRTTSPEGDVTYLQGVINGGNDRSVMPRYEAQITSLQGGRAGPGYQLAVGDVVAGFSGLSSSLGLRGMLGARQIDRVTVTGFAGTVAESWESLLNISALDGLAARSRYSRDVYGGKAELQYDETLSAFVTLQGWRDRTGSANLAPGSTALSGTSASVGGKYLTQRAQLTVEAARSQQSDISVGGPGFGAPVGVASPSSVGSGGAFTADGSYRWQSLGLRAGYHSLSTGYASLAQTVAPGVREWYAGGDWNISPEITWSSDLRHSLSRMAATAFFAATASELDSLTNRLTYNVAVLPGLMLGLTDTRSKGKDNNGASNRNEQTQYSVAYAVGAWNAQLGAGTGRSRNPATPLSDSNSTQWQFGLGRSFSDSSGGTEVLPAWSLSTQFFSSGQNQCLVNTGTEVRTLVLGLNASLQSQRWGSFNAGLQRQRSTQPLAGQPVLITNSFNLDWSLALTRQWTIKTYARINHRNHGDLLLQADERIVGVQGSYQW